MNITLKLKAPMAHGSFGDENLGNYSPFRKMPIFVDGQITEIPVISGNSIRTEMRRAIMSEWYEKTEMNIESFIEFFGETKGKRAWDRLYAVLCGGTIEKGTVGIRTEEVRELRKTYPSLSLFGSSMYSVMLSSVVNIGFGIPVCKETISSEMVVGDIEKAPNCAELLCDIGLTRHIDRENADPDLTGVTPMPYQVEALVAGTEVVFEINFERIATEIEKHCAAHALKLITKLGGKSAIGFGKIELKTDIGDDEKYCTWLNSIANKEDLIELARRVM